MAAKKKSPASDGAGRKARRRDARIGFEALSIEGGLLSPDWLARIAQLGAQGQSEADYRVPRGLALRDEIGRYWRIAQAHWTDFASGRKSGADARLLAERFVVALVRQCFGFESLAVVAPILIADRTYPIGHAALGGRAPLVVAAPKPDEEASARSALDEPRSAYGDGTRKRSPFGLVQEYLNAQESALWGLVSDGLTLRIVRDNASLTRPAWIGADLARIFAEERYADFAALWLLVHESRFGGVDQPVSACVLEAWRAEGREEGTRAREHLRRGVEEALRALGQGFVSHPANQALRATLETGDGAKKDFFNQLLRLVYRVIFLLTVEERGVLHAEGANEQAKRLYADGYSLRKLRERAVRRSAHDRHSDAWEAVKIVFRGVERGEPRLGLPALSGIFAASQCPTLDGAKLENRALMTAVFKLSWLKGESGLARVNWRDMGPEELGSVYESLLELVPVLTEGGRTFDFATGDETKGNARKTTGSYYTPDSLVQVLLDSALEPVVRETIAANPANPVDALLGLSIVDPACGSGHFLLAAARRLAAHVARLSTSGTPSAAEYRHALRQVVGRCIYGVDLNPMAVELCKVSLWMEAVEPGLPLTFLNSHIQHGNALLGTTPELMKAGVPDAAWEAIEGDDKKVAGALKKRNKLHANAAQGAWSFVTGAAIDEVAIVGEKFAELEAASDADRDALVRKEARWDGLLDSVEYRHQKLVADAWCAAFVWPKQAGELAEAAPTAEAWRGIRDSQSLATTLTSLTVGALAAEYRFFHWHLQFPHVFARGGFDIVLGNPPWIAHAGRAAQPLPPGVKHFCECNWEAFADYPTTHGMFPTVAALVLRHGGRLGLIIPSSLSELGGYLPTRRAHDRLCRFEGELVDFGEGQFKDVTQPCMALVSTRDARGRLDAEFGEPWPMQRPDLSAVDRQLLAKLGAMPSLPPELFGERGLQSDKALAQHFVESSVPTGRFTTPIREGTDVREFALLAPRFHVDAAALGGRLRAPSEFAHVDVVVRQTARYPIAAVADGIAFRNSLVATIRHPDWPADAMAALLNSALVRWAHYQRFRDARQPVMPQLKISHLRAIPWPAGAGASRVAVLSRCGLRLAQPGGGEAGEAKKELDSVVADLYGLTREEVARVSEWHELMIPRNAVRGEAAPEGTPLPDTGRAPSREASASAERGPVVATLSPARPGRFDAHLDFPMFLHALVAASGGSITRWHLANAYRLWSDRGSLRRNAAAPLAEAAAAWARAVARRPSCPSPADALRRLIDSGTLAPGIRNGQPTVELGQFPPLPTPEDAWFAFEAGLVLDVMASMAIAPSPGSEHSLPPDAEELFRAALSA